MADPKAKVVFEAEDRATASLRKLTGEFASVQASARKLGGALGAIGFGVLLTGVSNAISALDDLNDRAQTLDLQPEFLSSFETSARNVGLGVEQVSNAVGKFIGLLDDARRGSQEAGETVRALGIDVKDLRNGTISNEQALRKAADAVAEYRQGFEKTNLVQDAFGTKNRRLIALFNEGSEGLTKFSGATKESVEDAAKLSNEIDKLSAAWSRLTLRIGGVVARGINRILDDSTVNATEKVLERVEANIARLRKQLETQRNPEYLQAINIQLQEAEERAESLRQAIRSAAEPPKEPDRRPQRATPEELRAAEARKRFLEQLELEVVREREGEFAARRRQAAELGFRGKQAEAVERAIGQLEQEKRFEEELAAFAERAEEAEKRRERSDEAVDGQQLENSRRLKDLDDEIDAIGQTRLALDLLTETREIERQTQERVRHANDAATQSRLFEAGEAAKVAAQTKIVARAIKEQDVALSSLLKDIQFETQLIGLNNAQRQEAVLLRQLEVSGIEKGTLAYDRLLERIRAVRDAIDTQDTVLRQTQLFEDLGRAGAEAAGEIAINFRNSRSIVDSLADSVQRIITNLLVTAPLEKILTGFLRDLFGGGAPAGGAASSPLAGLFSQAFAGGFASGGYIPPGKWGWTGERGPEPVFGGRTGATVLPSAMPGLPPVTQNIYVQSIDRRDSRAQVARDAARALQSAVRRG